MKNKYAILAIGMALFVAAAAGCAKKASYNYYSPMGAGFSVELPPDIKTMTPEVQSIMTPVGPRTMSMYSAESKNVALYVSEFRLNLPDGAMLDVKKALEGGLVKVTGNGKVLKKEEITVDGNPGFSARIQTQSENGEVFIQLVQVIAGSTQFQLQAQAKAEKKLDTPEVKRFIESLKITAPKPEAPAAAPAEKPAEKSPAKPAPVK
ncbi:MAG: hypothetical protein WCX65_02285 [bacterium]